MANRPRLTPNDHVTRALAAIDRRTAGIEEAEFKKIVPALEKAPDVDLLRACDEITDPRGVKVIKRVLADRLAQMQSALAAEGSLDEILEQNSDKDAKDTEGKGAETTETSAETTEDAKPEATVETTEPQTDSPADQDAQTEAETTPLTPATEEIITNEPSAEPETLDSEDSDDDSEQTTFRR